MKTIDEIEKLSLEDLERISLDESIPVPEGLVDRIVIPVDKRVRFSSLSWAIGIAASLVIIAGLALTLKPRPLKDTFDDPAMAYAEVERALLSVSGTINDKMNNILIK